MQDSITLAGAWAWVRMSDNGPGIPAEHIPHLFDRFYRVDRARAHLEENAPPYEAQSVGSGLGLSIVQWVAQAHGGDVSVQSEIGVGSVFEVAVASINGEANTQEKPNRNRASATLHPEAVTPNFYPVLPPCSCNAPILW